MINQVVLRPFNYIEESKGKDVYKDTIDALQVWYGLPQKELAALRKIIHYFHIHSLM